MNWIDPKIELPDGKHLPPQGKKILYFKQGDIYVVQRFGKYWLPIPFHDSSFTFHDEPDFWADIISPTGYTGFLRLVVDGVLYTIDDLEIHHPEVYASLIHGTKTFWKIRDKFC